MNSKNTLFGSLLALGLSAPLWALPQDPTPVHGQVQIQNGANFIQILQQTPQAIINWGGFNIGLGETVRFLQPSQQAAILNRVTGLDPSVIQGQLQANGRVFLLNPNGILFGPNSVVDVGSFTASTLKMSNEDFLNGTYKLTQDNSLPLAALTNQGTIKVAEGGFVVLVSPLLDNQGMILAQSGHVNLGATTQATFSVDGRGLVSFVVPDGFDPKFQGGGNGGTVLLQPGQMSQLLSQVVTNPSLVEAGSFETLANGQVLAHGAEGVLLNSGTIRTDSTTGNGGTIRLDSSQATILPSGALLSANSQAGNGGDIRLLSAGSTFSAGTISAATNGTGSGGFVEVSGKDLWSLGVINVGSAQGTGGTILLDPTDITIIDGAGGTFDGQLPNPTDPAAAGAGTVSVSGMQGYSSVQLTATNDVLYNGSGFNLGATSLSVNAGNDIIFSAPSIQATALTLVAGRDISLSSTSGLTVGSNAGALTIQAGRNVSLTSNGSLTLSSPGQISVSATNGDLTTSSPVGSVTRFSATRTDLAAGRNLTLTGSDFDQPFNSPVYLSGRNVTIQGQNTGSLDVRVGSLNITATENFVGNATAGGLRLLAQDGPLNITAGTALVVNARDAITLQASTGRTTLTAPTINTKSGNGSTGLYGLQGVNVTSTVGDLVLESTGPLSLDGGNAGLNVTSARDLTLSSAGQLTLNSSSGTRLEATRDLSTSSPTGSVTRLSSTRTDLVAGRNLTLTASDVDQTANNPVYLSGRNVTIRSQNTGNVDVRVGSLNVTATENFVGNATAGGLRLLAQDGPLNITAGTALVVNARDAITLQASTGKATLTAPSINTKSANSSTSLYGLQGVNVTSTVGDIVLESAGPLSLDGGNAGLNVTSARDIGFVAGGQLTLNSGSGTRVEATRDLSTSSPTGSVTRLSAPRTDLLGGRNVTVTASDVDQVANNPVYLSGRNVTIQGQNTGNVDVRVGSLNITATENFVGNSTGGSLRLLAQDGPLNITAGSALAVNATNAVTLQASNGRTTLTAPTISVKSNNGSTSLYGLQGVNVTSTVGDIVVDSNGPLSLDGGSAALNVTSARDLALTAAGQLTLNSTSGTRLEAARHLSTSSPVGSVTRLSSSETNLVAGGNLTMSASDFDQTANNPVYLSARNVTIRSQSSGNVDVRVGSLNITATEDFVGNATAGSLRLLANSGPLNITAGSNLSIRSRDSVTLQAGSGRTTLTAPTIDVKANTGSASFYGLQGVNVTSSAGDIVVTSAGALSLDGGSAGLNVTSARDVALTAGGQLTLNSTTGTRTEAARDLTTSSPAGSVTRLSSTRTDLVAGRNLTLAASDVDQTAANPVYLSGQNVTIQGQNTGNLDVRVGSLNITASEAVTGSSAGGWTLRTSNGPLQITAGTNVSASAAGGLNLQSSGGALEVTAGNVNLGNVGFNASGGDLKLAATGNLAVFRMNVASNANATLTATNIVIESMQNVSGGNYTITATGNLTEVVAASNPPSLTGINITAGNAFNLSRPDLGFSVPNAGFVAGLVTGGNATGLPNDAEPRAAAFHTFTTDPNAFNPGHIDYVTGDIYRNGVQIYGGLKPPDPPEPPPSPPPTPEPTVPPVVVVPVTPEQAIQQQNALTPEQRSQILVQSNLGLGNLGSFSRVLSDTEREYLTTRYDSLHQTWNMDPFSPTLALTVPGGQPQVYPSELAQLQALLLSNAGDDPEEKNRQAYNVIIDQELREIWEVRYWRHLLESFILWEDRE